MEEFWGSVERGPYLGDVSALCLLPSRFSSPLPYLIAGTGPQVLLYELATGELLLSQQVFEGVRVHGIHALRQPLGAENEPSNSTLQASIAVHGERRVKVFELYWEHRVEGLPVRKPQLRLVHALPRFFQWILDVRFLQDTMSKPGDVQGSLLAVGLSNNSVSIWNLQKQVLIFRVECSERCLLYSLRLWGSSVHDLHIAAGTIFNKVLIWDLNSRSEEEKQPHHEYLPESKERKEVRLPFVKTVAPLQELLGHEGSIFRLAWSVDGLQVASASDDRSARIWNSSSPGEVFTAGPVLYGHGGRLWDCHVAENLLITASEDCTCRVWTPEGHRLATLTGHIGRGIWRCIYDDETATLITAGADSSIKVQSLDKWAHAIQARGPGGVTDLNAVPKCSLHDPEVLHISLKGPNVVCEGSHSSMDSNSEYVRCLGLADPQSIYIATNQGHIHHVDLHINKGHRWTKLTHEDVIGPVVCMSLLVSGGAIGREDDDSFQADQMVAFGNGLGMATALRVQRFGPQPEVVWQCTWLADRERQLLGVFWCRALGRRFVFTTDPRGLVRVWSLEPIGKRADKTITKGSSVEQQAVLLAICKSPLHARVVCLDVSPSTQLLVCGDQRGNLVSFVFPTTLLPCKDSQDCLQTPILLQSMGVFKGAHGISAVASISVTSVHNEQTAEILSTGRDGCICKFFIDTKAGQVSSGQSLVCTGVEDVTAITIVESVEYCRVMDRKKNGRRVATGFIASDFVLWDLTDQSELMRVKCGGWRRPHSCVVGDMPEQQYCFAYLKDQVIYVHRKWDTLPVMLDAPEEEGPVSTSRRRVTSLLPQSLHGHFHGREIHSVQFIPAVEDPLSKGGRSISWVATGAEDGAVRITRYDSKFEHLKSSMVLGEHTGGSAVRALTLVQGVHTVMQEPSASVGEKKTHIKDPILLLSVGAKEVLTCWLLQWRQDASSENDILNNVELSKTYTKDEVTICLSSADNYQSEEQLLSSKWLSSYAQSRVHHPSTNAAKSIATSKVSVGMEASSTPENFQQYRKEDRKVMEGLRKEVEDDDDLRFLAVTGFLTRCPGTESVVCFVVTASSNATLRLLALHPTSRSWMELAVLEYHAVPVLALQHLVVPLDSSIAGSSPNAYLVVSGATDGSIAVWDITSSVVTFTREVASKPMSALEAPLRPRTGRGSQGGRQWRSSKQRQAGISKKKKNEERESEVHEGLLEASRDNLEVDESTIKLDISRGTRESCVSGTENTNSLSGTISHLEDANSSKGKVLGSEASKVTGPHQASILYPIRTIIGAHKSGVNCLSVARVACEGNPVYAVISGGDDQALHIFKLVVQIFTEGQLPCVRTAMSTSTENSERQDSGEACLNDSEKLAREVFQVQEEKSSKDFVAPMRLAVTCSSQALVPCAHSSAVKGIWTDGTWVFSTGLDQRLRCWHVSPSTTRSNSTSKADGSDGHPGKAISNYVPLVECSHCVIDVPEAEDLHVEPDFHGKCYRIAVVGRGLQVLKFQST